MLERIHEDSTNVTLVNVRVADVRTGALGDESRVYIENGVIRDMDASGGGGAVIDCRGAALMPGLIECHSHILSPYLSEQKGIPGAWTLKQMKRNFMATLAAGVVCVRDMLAPIKVMNRERAAINAGKRPGPRILTSGAILSCKGGYPEFLEPVPFPLSAFAGQPKLNLESPEHARALVRALHRQGIDVAKVGYCSYMYNADKMYRLPVVSKEILDAICETAHELGLKVAVHHNYSDDMNRILESDIDSLEHNVSDREITDEEIAKIKSKGIVNVPTITAGESICRFQDKKEFLHSAMADQYFEPQAKLHLQYLASLWTDDRPRSWHKNFGRFRNNIEHVQKMKRNIRKNINAGLTMAAGTDMGAVVIFPGEMIDEIIRLNHIGMSRVEAIRTATLNAAKLVGLEDELGAIETGKRADVSIIDGNPFEDLEALRKVRYVGRGGFWYRALNDAVPNVWGNNPISVEF